VSAKECAPRALSEFVPPEDDIQVVALVNNTTTMHWPGDMVPRRYINLLTASSKRNGRYNCRICHMHSSTTSKCVGAPLCEFVCAPLHLNFQPITLSACVRMHMCVCVCACVYCTSMSV